MSRNAWGVEEAGIHCWLELLPKVQKQGQGQEKALERPLPVAVAVAGAQVLGHLTWVLAQEQRLLVWVFQWGGLAQASLLMPYVESQDLAKQEYGDTHMSLSSTPNVRLPNCTGNFSYAVVLPPKLIPESDEGELPGRMTA